MSSYLEQEAWEHAERWDWGLYRNSRFGLAESRHRQDRAKEALKLFLEVSIIDMNGPRNCGGNNWELLQEFPVFDAKLSCLAPGVLTRTEALIAELGLSINELRRLFDAVANELRSKLALPRDPESAWREFSRELQKREHHQS